MKKLSLAAAFIILLLLFSSCEKERGRMFDYQNSLKSVSGTYVENGTEYGMELYFTKGEDGKVYCRRAEYLSPESLAGLSFTLEGENITAELCGVRIADTWLEKDKVFRQARLFSLSEEDIYEIKTSKDTSTVVKGKSDGAVWQVTTNKEGLPAEIIYECEEGECKFLVEEIERNE